MLTEPMDAWQVGTGDILTMDSEVVGPIDTIEEDGDYLIFYVKDDDGDPTGFPFAPFATVRIFVSEDDPAYLAALDAAIDSVFED